MATEEELNQAMLTMAPEAQRWRRIQKDLASTRFANIVGPRGGGNIAWAKRPTATELRPLDRTPEELAMLDRMQAASEALLKLRENTDPFAAQQLAIDAAKSVWQARATTAAATNRAMGGMGTQILKNMDSQGSELRALNEEVSWDKATDSERTAFGTWRENTLGLVNADGEFPDTNQDKLFVQTAQALGGRNATEKLRMLTQMDRVLRDQGARESISQLAMNAEKLLENDPALARHGTPTAKLAHAAQGLAARDVARVVRVSELNDSILQNQLQFEDAYEKAGGGAGGLKALRQAGEQLGVYSEEGGWKPSPADEAANQQVSLLAQMNDALDTLGNTDPKFATERAEVFNSITSQEGFKEWKEAAGFLPGLEGDINAIEMISKRMGPMVKRNLAAAKASVRLGEAREDPLGTQVAGARQKAGVEDTTLAPTPSLIPPKSEEGEGEVEGKDPEGSTGKVSTPAAPATTIDAKSAYASMVGGADPMVDFGAQYKQSTSEAAARRQALRQSLSPPTEIV